MVTDFDELDEPGADDAARESSDWVAGVGDRVLLHAPTLSYGRVKRLWDGKTARWTSTVDGSPVQGAVVELDTGHGFLAIEKNFVVMTKEEESFVSTFQQGLSALIAVAVQGAASAGVPPENGVALLVAGLRSQLSALERTR